MEAVEPEPAAVVSCDCCGLEEECTDEYVGGVRDYFGGRWLCGLCSESVKYEAGRGKGTAAPALGVEEDVRAHMAFCRMLKRGGPAERVAQGMCQMLRRSASSGKPWAVASRSSLSSSTSLRPRAGVAVDRPLIDPPLSAAATGMT